LQEYQGLRTFPVSIAADVAVDAVVVSAAFAAYAGCAAKVGVP
jgi:hypothetical protein